MRTVRYLKDYKGAKKGDVTQITDQAARTLLGRRVIEYAEKKTMKSGEPSKPRDEAERKPEGKKAAKS